MFTRLWHWLTDADADAVIDRCIDVAYRKGWHDAQRAMARREGR